MRDLRTVKIGELGRVLTGRTPPSSKPELLGNRAAFITPTDIHEGSIYPEPQRRLSEAGEIEFRKLILPPDTVCFTCIASIGKMCLTREKSVTNQQINAIIVDQAKYDPRWVFYSLKNMRDQIAAIASGSATPIINKTAFSNIGLEVPPFETQQRIAAILGAYDDLIEVNRRRVAVLDEMARGLFEEYSRGVETTELLFAAANVSYGKNLPKSRLSDDAPYPVFGASKVIGRYSSFTHADRTIIVGCRGTVGQFQISLPNSFITNNSFTIEPHRQTDFAWVYFALRKRGIADTVSGSAQPQITLEGASRVEITFPEKSVRDAFSRSVMPTLQSGWIITDANAKLAASRDLLLPRLISGQLSLEAAERQLEDAA